MSTIENGSITKPECKHYWICAICGNEDFGNVWYELAKLTARVEELEIELAKHRAGNHRWQPPPVYK